MSPELIAPQRFGLKSSRPTESSDCYALGMVIYETISGNLPFHEDTDLTVFVKVLEGKRPSGGAKFVRGLWRMLERCWESQPNNRPTIEDVLRCLVFSNFSEPPSLEVDEGMQEDGDDRDSTSGSSDGTSDASTTTSFGLSHAIDHPPSPILVSIPRTDSDGGVYRVSAI
jgi:serine/threonine protein kinase